MADAICLVRSSGPGGTAAAGQPRTIHLAVTKNGFEPAHVKVTKGAPLKLVVTRKTDETCAKQIVIPSEKISAALPLNTPVTLSFTPKRTGEIKYACGMNMITGVLEVVSNDAPGSAKGHAQAAHGVGGPGVAQRSDQDVPSGGMSCGCSHGGSLSGDS